MNEADLLEFGIFHWVIGTETSLPGLGQDGYPSHEFFGPLGEESATDAKDIGFWLETHLSKWADRLEASPLILCSGGVDSSTLVATASALPKPYELLHTAYIKHNNNDLGKLVTLLEHFPSIAHVASIDSRQYLSGMQSLWESRILQNTYAPTIAYALNSISLNKHQLLVTGSGPDELFYGMEKYPFEYFQSKEHLPVDLALEQIDTAYNIQAYRQILSAEGEELLEQVLKKRRDLYSAIATICPSIYDAQRMLAYCTVTAQHIHLFDNVAAMHNMEHIAPFLDEAFIKLAFSMSIKDLIDPNRRDGKVEIGKYHLKRFLSKFMAEDHVFSKKIGFHAPTTSYMYSESFEPYFNSINYDSLPDFVDKGKARKLLSERLRQGKDQPHVDYFLYSILNISKFSK
jgi:uncharacterized protein YdhG (YjbR/CyaY superfamily)